MHGIAAACAGFLMAVLWFDLMFDVQARGPGKVLSDDVLASIGAYYARVVTAARGMSRLIPLVMLVLVGDLVAQVVLGQTPLWRAGGSLAAALVGIGLAMARTVRNAARIGAATDPPDVRTRLARSVLTDHLICLAAMVAVLGLQLTA